MTSSHAKTESNRQNAQHSTGPRTAEGKARSSMNATRHGLTGQVIVLPGEDLKLYSAFCLEFFTEWQPKGPTERHLVQTLADNQWRIHRAHAYELAIYANGQHTYGERVDTDRPDVHAALTAGVVELEHSRELDRLSRHGSRIQRDFENTLRRLQALQAERKERERQQLHNAALLEKLCEMKQEPHHPSDFGFVLTHTQVKSGMLLEECLRQAKIAERAGYDLPKFRAAGGSDGPIIPLDL